MASIIDKKMEIWKKKLLDLGMRNRLLNYHDTKRGTLNIVSPSIGELYDLLVINEKELSLPSVELRSILAEENEEQSVPVDIPGDIKTDRTGKETLLVAKNLRDKARTAQEEQGVNILYASFGFLEWRETQKSSTVISSPIILVPVVLSNDSITDPYILSLHEDEVLFNPTLAYKFENDFSLTFPEFDPQSSIEDYLDEVEKIVGRFGWKTNRKVSISLLSFLKINMYKDLERRSDIISSNSIIRAIAGYKVQSDYDFSEMSDYDHDKTDNVINTFQVVDADSSQQDAIVMSKKGASFVLQGPPGTGKSQTITNIIAEGLADGKKILFVSEKMAALDVVYRRLEQAHLSDFCLVLHSNKANKRELLDSLRKVLDLKQYKIKDDAIRKLHTLEERRKALNAYCDELHQVLPPLNQSVFDANGIISSLSDIPDVDFDMSKVQIDKITKDQLFSIEQSISDFVRTLNNMAGGYEDNIWSGTTIKNVNHQKRNELLSLFDRVNKAADAYNYSFDPFCAQLNITKDWSVADLEQISEMFRFAGTSKKFPEEWLSSFDGDALLMLVNVEANNVKEIKHLREDIKCDYNQSVFELNADELINIINNEYADFNNEISDKVTAETFFNRLDSYESVLLEYSNKIKAVDNEITCMQDQIELFKTHDFADVERLYKFLVSFNSDIRPDESWFDSGWRDSYARTKVLVDAEGIFQKYKSQKEKLLKDYDPEILNIDYTEILKRCRTEYTSVLRVFNSSFRDDCKLIRSLKIVPVKSLKYEELLVVAEDVKLFHDIETQFKSNEDLYIRCFGGWFDSSNTNISDISEISDAWNRFAEILEFYDYSVPDKTKKLLLSGKNEKLFSKECLTIKEFIEGDAVVRFEDLTGCNRYDSSLEAQIEIVKKMLSRIAKVRRVLASIETCAIIPKTNYEYCKDIGTLVRYQNMIVDFEKRSKSIRNKLYYLYNGEETDWNDISDRINWFNKFNTYIEKNCLSVDFCKGIANDEGKAILSDNLADFIEHFLQEHYDAFVEFDALYDYDILSLNPTEISSMAHKCSNKINDLESWVDFARARNVCKENGISALIELALRNQMPTEIIEKVFKKRFERLWIDYAMTKLPAVEGFRTRRHKEMIEEFRQLDVEQLKIAQFRVREKLLARIPDSNSFTSSNDELGILKHELNKQRKIMPVRKLFDRIPNLLPCLKPCLMMSPLSVSQYLQTENYIFDLVIFDEASQVRTENAIGAISRAKQVIIAGDIHQLPPTNFFSASISGSDEYDEDEDTDSYESVLDESNSVLPQLTLRWHYRSRDESLIAFSNSKIYNNALVTFPSPNVNADSDGVEFFYVKDGLYNRSTKRNNPIEAKKVVDIIFENFRKHPNRSVGVITFSEAQQSCVEEEVLRRRLNDPSYEEFFSLDKEEPFFIKNLENVQGDERDTIIFSVGYGKSSQQDEVRMNFGPLNREGGYRRLNVAITRAKFNVKLVCSFLPTDLRITDATPKGVKLLRDYIDYAQNGYSVLNNAISVSDEIRTESPFEDSVYDFLVGNGYEVATQVGCSGYRIDLGIKHPTLHGKFVLGVECDGATYHSSRTARERDRLRQSVLESMGWSFYRIWSTDWIKDPVSEGNKLIKAIKHAIYLYDSPREINEASCNDSEYYEETERDESSGYGFGIYEELVFPKALYYEAPMPQIAEAVDQIVKEQSPIHVYYVGRQIAPLLCNVKVTNKVVSMLDRVITVYSKTYGWKRTDEYLWDAANKDALPKVPGDGPVVRAIEYIAPEELSTAMQMIIGKSFGIDKSTLFKAVTREYGFLRCTAVMEKQLEIAYQLLMNSREVRLIDGKHSLSNK